MNGLGFSDVFIEVVMAYPLFGWRMRNDNDIEVIKLYGVFGHLNQYDVSRLSVSSRQPHVRIWF